METKKESATADVPTFKIARVGNDRKKKKGGFSFLRSGGSRGAWSGASGGAGAGGTGGLLGMSINQLVAVVAMLGAMASGVAFMVARDARIAKKAEPKKAEVFAKSDVKLEGDTSNLQGDKNTIPNSLGYLSGSKDGLTDEERAKRDADAAAAAEAQRLADEEAAKKAAEAEKNAAKEPAAVDPMAAAAAAGAGGPNGAGGFGKKFGALSSSFGGGSGLAGGAGMSGGMNGSFGRGVGVKGGASGRLSGQATVARPKQSARPSSKMGRSTAKGFARRQLTVASAWSRRAVGTGNAQTASVNAGNAFDSNVGAGTAITGGGMAPGAPGSADASGGGVAAPGTQSGGALNTGETEPCGGDKSQIQDPETGLCGPMVIPEGKSASEAIDIMAKIAMGLLAAIAVISAIKAACDGSFVAAGYGAALGGLMGAMALIIAGMGIAMIAMGAYAQGIVFTGVGAFIATVCFAPFASSILTSGTMIIAAAAGAVLGVAAGMLDSAIANKNAPEAAQQ